MKKPVMRKADILLPKEVDYEKWAVIACDQYTSEPAYWKKAEEIVKDAPSTLRMIVPEAYLAVENASEIGKIHSVMEEYLSSGLFQEYRDSYVYVERTLSNSMVRRGIVGCIDLEEYDYHENTDAAVRATEKTVAERIPPRMAVREGALLEFPHVLMLCDDDQGILVEEESLRKETLPKLYDTDLMLNGGHITGWLISGKDAEDLDERLQSYMDHQEEKFEEAGLKPVYFTIGDGNHSLASAKECYEELKQKDPSVSEEGRRERYVLVELENVHDPIQVFEPIHRIMRDVDPDHFLQTMKEESSSEYNNESHMNITWITENDEGILTLDDRQGSFALGVLQPFLDSYMDRFGGELDYIHGEESLRHLSNAERTVGILVPAVRNNNFFMDIVKSGVFPRKTFSIGEANDKRYYMEGRRILEK